MLRTYKYRIYPNNKQKILITKTLETCCWFYNELLLEQKNIWEKQKKRITCFEQNKSLPKRKEINPILKNIHSQVLQDIVKRVHKNFQDFFQRLKKKIGKVGYPRFKPFNRMKSFTYPQYIEKRGFWIYKKQLKLPKLGLINIRLHQEIIGKIKTCSVIVRNNKYYVSFVCEKEPKLLPKTNEDIGIDLGLTTFVATSDRKLYRTPKFYRKTEKKIVKADRKVSRRVKGSKRRTKAIVLLSKHHERIINQRKDFAHKLVWKIIKKYDRIVVEKLQVNNMTKNKFLAKSIKDVGWTLFKEILIDKVEYTGRQIKEISPNNTSQICSSCDKKIKQKLKLNQRKFNCSYCDYKDNRDINATRNILKRAEWVGSTLQGAVPVGAV